MEWTPEYDSWRHGGWYVTNVAYPGGGCGCVSRNFADRKWRIMNLPMENGPTFANRDEAARAEHAYTKYLDAVTCPKPVLPGRGSGFTWPDGSIAWRCKLARGHKGKCAD